MVAGRKVAGVLCESAGERVVAGVGLNVRRPEATLPAEVAARATSLEGAGCPSPSRSTLAAALLREMRGLCAVAGAGLGAAELAELAHRDALRDKVVVTEQEGVGTARGIEADGSLALERPDGSRVRVRGGGVRPA
jgi:BirA family biotin operon repressor/biotin-[acetyl-CoA-carboxylase] ligase